MSVFAKSILPPARIKEKQHSYLLPYSLFTICSVIKLVVETYNADSSTFSASAEACVINQGRVKSDVEIFKTLTENRAAL